VSAALSEATETQKDEAVLCSYVAVHWQSQKEIQELIIGRCRVVTAPLMSDDLSSLRAVNLPNPYLLS